MGRYDKDAFFGKMPEISELRLFFRFPATQLRFVLCYSDTFSCRKNTRFSPWRTYTRHIPCCCHAIVKTVRPSLFTMRTSGMYALLHIRFPKSPSQGDTLAPVHFRYLGTRDRPHKYDDCTLVAIPFRTCRRLTETEYRQNAYTSRAFR